MTVSSSTEADGDLNTPTVALVGLVGALIFFAITIFLQVLYYEVNAREGGRKDENIASSAVASLREQQLAELQDYYWINQDQNVVKIPIRRAMELVVAEGAHGVAPLTPYEAAPAPQGTQPTGAAPAAEGTKPAPEATKPAPEATPAAPAPTGQAK